jgi:2-polyprenyl-6-methoxyphenol hydroxylase-like FAD-dependent oxidoreductase
MNGRRPAAVVVIIGAGPTGVTAATLLAQYGIETLILDRWPTVYPQPRAVHLDDEVFRIVDRLGVGAEFAEDRVDVVLGVTVETFEAIDLEHLAVATEEAEAFRLGPLGERTVVALAGADERGGDEQRALLQ